MYAPAPPANDRAIGTDRHRQIAMIDRLNEVVGNVAPPGLVWSVLIDPLMIAEKARRPRRHHHDHRSDSALRDQQIGRCGEISDLDELVGATGVADRLLAGARDHRKREQEQDREPGSD